MASRLVAPGVAAVALGAILVEVFKTRPNGYVFLIAAIVGVVALVWLGDHPERDAEVDR